MARIAVNVRTLRAPATGVQRYAREVVDRLGDDVDRIEPARRPRGIPGHLWEQTVLPRRVGDRLLFSPGGTGPWRLQRHVVAIHDAAPLDHPEWFDRKFAAWYGFVVPRLLRRATRVITISEFSRRRLLSYVPDAADRMVVTLLAAGEAFAPAPADRVADARRRYGLEDPYVLVVGSLQPRKNLARLLAAWREVQGAHPDVRLAVAGMRLDEIFGRAGFDATGPGVRLLGYVADADLPPLYTGAEAVAYPSLYEGYGLPAVEALACGAALLASSAGALPEVVGDAGLVVDPEVDALAAGLGRLLGDAALREQLRAAAPARAATFSWHATAAATRAVLEDALREAPARA